MLAGAVVVRQVKEGFWRWICVDLWWVGRRTRGLLGYPFKRLCRAGQPLVAASSPVGAAIAPSCQLTEPLKSSDRPPHKSVRPRLSFIERQPVPGAHLSFIV